MAGVAFAIPLLWSVSNAIPHPESYLLTYINVSAGSLFLRRPESDCVGCGSVQCGSTVCIL